MPIFSLYRFGFRISRLFFFIVFIALALHFKNDVRVEEECKRQAKRSFAGRHCVKVKSERSLRLSFALLFSDQEKPGLLEKPGFFKRSAKDKRSDLLPGGIVWKVKSERSLRLSFALLFSDQEKPGLLEKPGFFKYTMVEGR